MNHSVKKPAGWKSAVCTLLLSGCASVPPPIEQLSSARAAVADAVSSGATELAPMEMKRAQAKLDDASAAMAAKEYARARKSSEQAELDAKLAGSKALSAKAQKELAQLEQNIRALQAEITRRAP